LHVAGDGWLWVVWPFPAQMVLSQLRHGDSFRRPALTGSCPPPFRRRTVPLAARSSSDRSRSCRELLSWGFSKTSPPPTSLCASTLGCPRFGVATPELVPPLSFFPTSAAYSAHSLQVCCTLQPVMGFAWFRAGRRLTPNVRPSSQALLPSEVLRLDSGFPVARVPASSSLVRGDRSHPFPRPRGVVPSKRSTCSVTTEAITNTGTNSHGVSLDPGFHRTLRCQSPVQFFVAEALVPDPPSPEVSCCFQMMPGAFRIGCPAQRPLSIGARRLPVVTLAGGTVALETATGFPTVCSEGPSALRQAVSDPHPSPK